MEDPQDSTINERDVLNQEISLIRTLIDDAGVEDKKHVETSDGAQEPETAAVVEDHAEYDTKGADYIPEEGEVPLVGDADSSFLSHSESAEEGTSLGTGVEGTSLGTGVYIAQRILKESSKMIEFKSEDTTLCAETCLMMNRAYQESLSDTINSINIIMAHSRERQKTLELEIEEGLATNSKNPCGREKLLVHFGVPYFKDGHGMKPPPNPDSLSKNMEYEPYNETQRIWVENDSETLKKAIASDSLKKIMQPLMSRKAIEIEKLEVAGTEEKKAEIKDRLEALEADIIRAKFTQTEDLYGDPNDMEAVAKLDWMKISAFDFDGKYSESFLQSRWVNHIHPRINKSKWTSVEDESLSCIAEAHRFRNWDAIARTLNTSRSAFQCVQRFQTKLAPSLTMGPWSTEEDDALRNIVETFSFDNYIAWHQVSSYMEGRTKEQCMQRWLWMNKANKKGKWSTEEDVKLSAAVHCYGRNWNKIQLFLPERSCYQIRERWVNSLDRNLKYGKWTYEEDRQLYLAVDQFGEKWSVISKKMEGRTDNMLLQRYKRLVEWKRKREAAGDDPNTPVKTKKVSTESLVKVEKESEERPTKPKTRFSSRDKAEAKSYTEDKSGSEEVEEEDDEEDRLTKLARNHIKKTDEIKRKEQEMIERDIEQGIYIPRPTDAGGSRSSKNVEKRKALHDAIMRHVHSTLKTTAKGDPHFVYDKLCRHLAMNNMPLKLDTEVYEDLLDTPSPTVQNLLDKVESIKKGNKRMALKKKPDISDIIVEKKCQFSAIDKSIMKCLGLAVTSSSKNKPLGRPKKYSKKSEQGDIRSKDVEKKISHLMLTTMNIDKQGTAVMAKAILKAKAAKDQDLNQSIGSQLDNDIIHTPDNIAEIDPVVKREELGAAQKNMRLSKRLAPNALVHGMDEHDRELVLVSPADEMAVNDVELLQEAMPLTSLDLRPRVYRRNLVGQAGRIYNIPPLPPNTSTLRAFKTLMLNRRLLVSNARNYHLPDTLDGKTKNQEDSTKTVSQEQASCVSQEISCLQSAVHSVEKHIPAKVKQILDETLHSSDITPEVVRTLSKNYSIQDITAAREILKRNDMIERQKKLFEKEELKNKVVLAPAASGSEPIEPRTLTRRALVKKAKKSHDYQLLKSRFMSMFLWPAIMSSFELPKVSEQKSGTEKADLKRKKRGPKKGAKKAKLDADDTPVGNEVTNKTGEEAPEAPEGAATKSDRQSGRLSKKCSTLPIEITPADTCSTMEEN